MELVDGETPRRTVTGLIVFGDGRHDKRIMRALLHKFNGRTSVVVPTLPHHTQGGEACARAVIWLVNNLGKFPLVKHRIIVVIDREHERLLIDKLKKMLIVRERAQDNVIEMTVETVAGKSAELIVLLMGHRVKIEENIAILIKELYGVDVRPDKKEIRRALRRLGKREENLIEEANENQLRRAFGRIIDILKRLAGA